MPGKRSLHRWVLAADIFSGVLVINLVYFLVGSNPSLAAPKHTGLTLLDVLFYVTFMSLVLTSVALNSDYAPGKRYSRLSEAGMLARSSLVSFALLVSSAFLLEDFVLSQNEIFSRPGIVFMVTVYTFLLIDIRLIAHSLQSRWFDHGGFRKKMVIVGAGAEGAKVYDHLKGKNWLGVKCLGFVDQKATGAPVAEAQLLGRVEDLPALVAERGVEEIVIALPPEEHELMQKIVNNGVRQNVKLRIIPDALAYPYSNIDIQEYDGLAMIDVSSPRLDVMHSGVKRIMDIGLALVLLVFDLPFMLFIAVGIKLSSRGPVIFRQTRLGKDGKSFEMMKFRSMVIDADSQRKKLERRNEAKGPIFKIRDDPRITRFGRLLRRTSLDELPQIINVLKGDMSMVGPRPPLPEEVGRYKSHHLKRLAVCPGVTGLWQVSGRDRRDFEDMAKLDLYYIENWSGWMDLKIILKTIPVVLSRRGAY